MNSLFLIKGERIEQNRSMEKQSKFKLYYRISLVLIAVVSVLFTIVDRGRRTLIYYTTWSVWFSSLTSFCALTRTIYGKEEDRAYELLKFCSTVMITATFVMSCFSLPDKIWERAWWTAGSTFKHFLLPVAVIFDQIAFTKKGSYKKFYPIASMLAPFAYWTAVLSRIFIARAYYGGAIPLYKAYDYYPYPFLYLDGGVSVAFVFTFLGVIAVCLFLLSILAVKINCRYSIEKFGN